MKLSFFSVKNFRSITLAYKMEIRENTVLLGKNNEGKTNVLKALMLAMDILRNSKYIIRRAALPRSVYDWRDDYPIHLQTNKTKTPKCTVFKLEFLIEEGETKEIKEKIGVLLRKEITIEIIINEENIVELKIVKRGKNTSTTLSNKAEEICKYLCGCIDVQYIPAIRSEKDALTAISSLVESEFSNSTKSLETEEYLKAKEVIERYQNEKLEALEKRINGQLNQFLPKLKSVRIGLTDKYSRVLFRKDIDVEIDDGVLTNLSKKGDGVKSLITIALLSETTTDVKNRIIIIDEPENHLHPEAIHYIKEVLSKISNKHQIIISTHSPIFVNRLDIKSNIIVRDSKAEPANRIDDIRTILGTLTSDNLQYADYVIIVEGLTDKTILGKYFEMFEKDIFNLIKSNKITIRNIAGIRNLNYELMGLERYCCHFKAFLDYDDAGRNASKDAMEKLHISNEYFRFFKDCYFENSEIEDLIEEEVYDEYLKKKQIDIRNGLFRNKTKKWADRIKSIALTAGIALNDSDIDNIKKDISNLVYAHKSPFKESAITLLKQLSEAIIQDVVCMNIN